MAFRGWPPEAHEFYVGLLADNSKAYWEEHKALYQEAVLAPMEALLADLGPEFGEGKIFRPYRDVRFSRDKAPYKTAIGATLSDGGYVQFSTEGLAAGAGMYHLAPDQLERYRTAVADDRTGGGLAALVAEVRAQGIDVAGHETLKTAPRGYPKDHPRIELLRYKGLITWREWAPGVWLSRGSAKNRVVEFFRASKPITGWLDKHVGPSELPDDRRR
ncbi:MAG: DUF2461 domain-containing protein [Micromonosporaceae bacterium]